MVISDKCIPQITLVHHNHHRGIHSRNCLQSAFRLRDRTQNLRPMNANVCLSFFRGKFGPINIFTFVHIANFVLQKLSHPCVLYALRVSGGQPQAAWTVWRMNLSPIIIPRLLQKPHFFVKINAHAMHANSFTFNTFSR